VLVQVEYSTVNYKDALAITGKMPIVRSLPLVGGIDYSGTVLESKNPSFKTGDKVVMNGMGASETLYGGYSKYAKVNSGHLVLLPETFSTRDAMAIGTAGYTAALCVMKLVDSGITPSKGPTIVTGAVGGVGSFSVALLSTMGYTVIALTGRVEGQSEYLKALGASEVADRATLETNPKPLGKQLYAGAVDCVGGDILANIISNTKYGGVVAACGLAASTSLNTSVMPFILRGVTLAGVDSVYAPMKDRVRAWQELATVLDRTKLKIIAPPDMFISLGDLTPFAEDMLEGKQKGRVVVDVNVF
jgi:acrylyl-CoA reductase (NADPH)